MDDKQIMQEFEDAGAMLTGHFILSCGLRSPAYPPDALPPGLAAISAVKPGSRDLKSRAS